MARSDGLTGGKDMVLCNPDCVPLCDFCVWLDRPDPHAGESLCTKHDKIVDWLDACEDFHCGLAGNEDA